jgi:hypothetical protein
VLAFAAAADAASAVLAVAVAAAGAAAVAAVAVAGPVNCATNVDVAPVLSAAAPAGLIILSAHR